MKANAENNSNSENRELRGSVLLVAGRVFSILVNFSIQVLTVRYLVKSDYGILAFAVSITTMLSVFCALGLDKAASRFLSRYIEKQDVQRFWGGILVLFVSVTTAGILVAISLIGSFLLGVSPGELSKETHLIIAVVAGLVVSESLNAVFTSTFAVLASARSILFRRHILGPLLKLVMAVFVIATGGSLLLFAAGQLIASILGTLTCIPLFFSLIGKRSELKFPGWTKLTYPLREMLSYGFTLLIGDVAFVLRGAMIPVLIGCFFLSEEVASYQAVMPLARLNEFVLLTFAIMFLPKASRLADSRDPGPLQDLYNRNSIWITYLSFPLFSLSFLASDFLPWLLFGDQYVSSGILLALLSIAFYVNASFGISLRLIRAIGNVRYLLYSDLVQIAFAICVASWLIPIYGAWGAAISVVSCYVFQTLIYVGLVAATTPVRPLSLTSWIPFATGLAICVSTKMIALSFEWPPIYGLLAAIAATLLFLILFYRALEVEKMFPEIQKLSFWRSRVRGNHVGTSKASTR